MEGHRNGQLGSLANRPELYSLELHFCIKALTHLSFNHIKLDFEANIHFFMISYSRLILTFVDIEDISQLLVE